MQHLELPVTADQSGQRLDHFVVEQVPGQSRSQIQRLIKEGQIRVGGHDAKPNYLTRAGDTVTVDVPDPAPATPQPEALPIDVLFEDADLIVVNKPAGMVVHPAPGHTGGTLVNALLHYVDDLSGIGGELRPGIVHRLDRGTSGVMVVAKNDASHREMARQFHDREVEKEYVALVWGLVQQGRRIDAAIGRDPNDRQKMSNRARHARSAVTRVTRAQFLKGVSYLHVAIATGRTHQIRVHLSGIGHPIVGDTTYGGVRRHMPAHLRAVLRLERPFLHAQRLSFIHPTEPGRRLEFTAPLPVDLQDVLDELVERAKAAADEENGN
ncbi:MAG: RluA family pseudouridine synthase [Acidobacteria bacterium]|nr:RluA family pseudouridine synthase [Acidobacteriota bacterium]